MSTTNDNTSAAPGPSSETPAPPSTTAPPLTLLQLKDLTPAQLPAHPSLSAAQKDSSSALPSLSSFIQTLLHESSHFADTTIPHSFKRLKTTHLPRSKGGAVDVCAGGEGVDDPSANNGRGAYWFARRSRHALVPAEVVREQGKASWEEFVEALYLEHSVKEGEYTPDIFEARKVCRWDCEGVEVDGWTGIGLEIYEMIHSLPFPLSPRLFSTLVLTARDSPTAFIVAQVPVFLANVHDALYASGRHKTEGDTPQKRKSMSTGRYVSVERCKQVEDGTAVQWDMATASDAGGNLPMAAQKIALPNVIAKDVEYVMDWAWERREKPKGARS